MPTSYDGQAAAGGRTRTTHINGDLCPVRVFDRRVIALNPLVVDKLGCCWTKQMHTLAKAEEKQREKVPEKRTRRPRSSYAHAQARAQARAPVHETHVHVRPCGHVCRRLSHQTAFRPTVGVLVGQANETPTGCKCLLQGTKWSREQ